LPRERGRRKKGETTKERTFPGRKIWKKEDPSFSKGLEGLKTVRRRGKRLSAKGGSGKAREASEGKLLKKNSKGEKSFSNVIGKKTSYVIKGKEKWKSNRVWENRS